MIIDKLRAETRQAHEDLEREMLPQIRSVRDKKSYESLLRLFYGYYQPLEKDIARYIGPAVIPDFEERRKTSWILDDLRELGLPDTDIPVDREAPVLNSTAAAIGALYVMEGSTLGGKVICKMIADNMGITDSKGLSFFNGYGAQTGSRWKTFLVELDKFSGSADEAVIVESANRVFSGFQAWILLHTAPVQA